MIRNPEKSEKYYGLNLMSNHIISNYRKMKSESKKYYLMKKKIYSLFNKLDNVYKKTILKNKNIFIKISKITYENRKYSYFKNLKFSKMIIKSIMAVCEFLLGMSNYKKIKKINQYTKKFICKNKFGTIEFDNTIISISILIASILDEHCKLSGLPELMLLLTITTTYLSVIFNCTHHYKFRGEIFELKNLKLNSIVKVEIGLFLLQKYSKYLYNDENIDFYLIHDEYKSIDNNEYRRIYGTNLINKYICQGSSKEINISSQARKEIMKALDPYEIHIELHGLSEKETKEKLNDIIIYGVKQIIKQNYKPDKIKLLELNQELNNCLIKNNGIVRDDNKTLLLMGIKKFTEKTFYQAYLEICQLINTSIYKDFKLQINKLYDELCYEYNIIVETLIVVQKYETYKQ